jgi:antitoxin component YwqK of YwqJK toxin-antitoxin module
MQLNKTSLGMNDELIFLNGESTPFTGKIQDTLSNKMIVEFNVVKGIKHGQYLLFNLKGNLVISGFMENNKNDGNWEYFYDNGQLECTGDFNNDKPTGKWIWFYKNGIKKCEGIFSNGILEGKWVKYGEDGCLNIIINYGAGEILSIVEIDKPRTI